MKWSFTSVSIAFHVIFVEINLKLRTNACEFHLDIQLLYFVSKRKLYCRCFQKQKFNNAEEMHKRILFYFKFFIYCVSIRMKHGLF